MKFKISLLSVVMGLMSANADAQTARNPLNHEPMRMSQHQSGFSAEKLSETVYYRADGSPFDKSSLVYDEAGRKKAEITQRRNDNDGQWQNVLQSEYFTVENKEIEVLSSWTAASFSWTKASKTETFYNTERKASYALSYSWSGISDDWSLTPSAKSQWIYDEKGRVTENLKQSMNKETNAWIDYARILYTYNEDGMLSEEIYQTWNPERKTWSDKGKYTFSKENDKHKVATSYFYTADKWVYDGKIIHSHDNDGRVVRSEYYGEATDNSLKVYCIYTYSDKYCLPKIEEVEAISVHPNPVVSSFELTVPASFVGKTAGIFDIYGKPMKTFVVTGEKMQVSVSGLPSGVYIIKTDDKSAKFVVK